MTYPHVLMILHVITLMKPHPRPAQSVGKEPALALRHVRSPQKRFVSPFSSENVDTPNAFRNTFGSDPEIQIPLFHRFKVIG